MYIIIYNHLLEEDYNSFDEGPCLIGVVDTFDEVFTTIEEHFDDDDGYELDWSSFEDEERTVVPVIDPDDVLAHESGYIIFRK